MDARSFNRKVCGAAWINSKATKNFMFQNSLGSLSSSVCERTKFTPQHTTELQNAVDTCLTYSPKGDCPDGQHGPIGKWDVSRVTDMSSMLKEKPSFNGDISKWDVSSVTRMAKMFRSAKNFNAHISKWDVSSQCHRHEHDVR